MAGRHDIKSHDAGPRCQPVLQGLCSINMLDAGSAMRGTLDVDHSAGKPDAVRECYCAAIASQETGDTSDSHNMATCSW